MSEVLVMKFEPHTIEHLGVKMYSHVPPALAELIANSYDACSERVDIFLKDNQDEMSIQIRDNGDGMNFDEVNNYFLRIGRNRRKEGQETSCDRKPTGKKGLGKLALFGLGRTISIRTVKESKAVSFILDYDTILEWQGSDYKPQFDIEDTDESSGTQIILSKLNRKSGFPVEDYAISLSKLFNFPDSTFKVFISKNDDDPIEIHNKLKYESIVPEFEWDYSEITGLFDSEYENKDEISGKLITTEKPLKPGLRGVTLFANGRLVNLAEFFGRSESSHFFSYLTGWLNVDYIDDFDEDLISTDRQSLNWDHPETADLRKFLSNMLRAMDNVWREKRKEKRQKDIKEKTDVDIATWMQNIPNELKDLLEPIINNIDTSELSIQAQSQTIKNLNTIVPDYPYFHWRHLHPEIKEAAREDYIKKDYYRAFTEAAKRYLSATRKKSGSKAPNDSSMMGSVYGRSGSISVTHSFLKPDGTPFSTDTIENIEDGQKFLSMGIVAGGRNPVSHEEISHLRDSGLFSEKDCLDGLSLLSHLMKRLCKA
jgi:conserved hypothetical protein TIGR02391